jgi:hypothetical protein
LLQRLGMAFGKLGTPLHRFGDRVSQHLPYLLCDQRVVLQTFVASDRARPSAQVRAGSRSIADDGAPREGDKS